MSNERPAAGIPRSRPFDDQRFGAAVRELLTAAGFETDNNHLQASAEQVLKLWRDRLLAGYDTDPAQLLGEGFEDPGRDMVVVRDLSVHGLCPHHLLPWRGVAHVAYLPGGQLYGFGRLTRLVDSLCRRLTYQEWFTRDVTDTLVRHGGVRGAACMVRAEQLCLILGEDRRGEERVVTTSFAGVFDEDHALRQEFLSAVRVG